jgi:hypothetical protein
MQDLDAIKGAAHQYQTMSNTLEVLYFMLFIRPAGDFRLSVQRECSAGQGGSRSSAALQALKNAIELFSQSWLMCCVRFAGISGAQER